MCHVVVQDAARFATDFGHDPFRSLPAHARLALPGGKGDWQREAVMTAIHVLDVGDEEDAVAEWQGNGLDEAETGEGTRLRRKPALAMKVRQHHRVREDAQPVTVWRPIRGEPGLDERNRWRHTVLH